MKITIIALFILISSFVFTYLKTQTKIKKLKEINKNRNKLSKEDFVKYFEKKDYKNEYSSTLYDEIKNRIKLNDFILFPEDDLRKICDLNDMEDIEFIDKLCIKLNLAKPDQIDLESLSQKYSTMNSEYLLDLFQNILLKK
jgi:hypothetical protein